MTKLLLAAMAAGLLDEVENHYADAGAALPDRRLIAPGAPGQVAWDCEQLTIALASINPGTGGGNVNLLPQQGSPAGVGLTRLATWAIQVVRCSPTQDDEGNPPLAAAIGTAGLASLEDAGLMSQCLVELAALTPGIREWLPIGAVINAGMVSTLGPDGGFQAVEATVTISAMEVG